MKSFAAITLAFGFASALSVGPAQADTPLVMTEFLQQINLGPTSAPPGLVSLLLGTDTLPALQPVPSFGLLSSLPFTPQYPAGQVTGPPISINLDRPSVPLPANQTFVMGMEFEALAHSQFGTITHESASLSGATSGTFTEIAHFVPASGPAFDLTLNMELDLLAPGLSLLGVTFIDISGLTTNITPAAILQVTNPSAIANGPNPIPILSLNFTSASVHFASAPEPSGALLTLCALLSFGLSCARCEAKRKR